MALHLATSSRCCSRLIASPFILRATACVRVCRHVRKKAGDVSQCSLQSEVRLQPRLFQLPNDERPGPQHRPLAPFPDTQRSQHSIVLAKPGP